MKYKVGDKVRVRSKEWYDNNKSKYDDIECGSHMFYGKMSYWCGKVVTIQDVYDGFYRIREDGNVFKWTDEMIEGLVDEDINIDVAVEETTKDISDKVVDTLMGGLMVGKSFNLPQGYQFVDENGNVINATKIVLEKKKKDVNLTQEQINKMVHDSCVLFCKHSKCGIPRETCTSLGTCKEHDEYRTAIRTHLMEKKKKEYPKTYKECCEILDVPTLLGFTGMTDGEADLYGAFVSLKRCRDAYWKIAGEEMGLGKPWKPDWSDEDETKWVIFNLQNKIKLATRDVVNAILAFPTEEMRDAFYENFKELIEQCKELL